MEVEDKKPIKLEKPAPRSQPEGPGRNRRMAVIIIGAALLLVVGFGIGWLGSIKMHYREQTIMPMTGFMRHSRGIGPINPTDGTAYTRLTGVVTQVSGSTFTIAGNGTTKTITTTSNTTYEPSSQKPAVNDSVVVLGSDANGAFTATAVDILNK